MSPGVGLVSGILILYPIIWADLGYRLPDTVCAAPCFGMFVVPLGNGS